MTQRQTKRAPRITAPEVAAVFDAYPPKFRRKLMALRRLIYDVAARTEGVGELEETLKWGEPAYLPSQTKSGTTVRIDWKPRKPGQYALYLHCGTDLVGRFREMFPEALRFEGNRAIVFEEGEEPDEEALAFCIAAALTYHRDKKAERWR